LETLREGSDELMSIGDSCAAGAKKATVTHCNILQHTATHCNTLQVKILSNGALQHTATVCDTFYCKDPIKSNLILIYHEGLLFLV